MRAILLCVLTAAAISSAWGQEFEVVSIKPAEATDNNSDSDSDDERLTASNVSLKSLIVAAYEVKDYQVEGPDWLASARFDIVAKFPEALPHDPVKHDAALGAMLQKMLADRCKPAIHRDRKSFTVYGLVVEKKGIKFKETPDTGSHSSHSNNTHYIGSCISMETFAAFLARLVDLPVLDMTGLKGFYDVTLDWFPEPKSSADVADTLAGPALPAALQEQLGLKLETRKAPIEMIVVDHAEKLPTEN